MTYKCIPSFDPPEKEAMITNGKTRIMIITKSRMA
jgi:hypothetical protein